MSEGEHTTGPGSAHTAPSGTAGGYNARATLTRISLRDLFVEACIGVPEGERRRPQTLHMNLDLFLNAGQASRNDRISETVNYSELAVFVRRFVGQLEPVRLLETLAYRVSQGVLARYSRVHSLRVAIRKPHVIARSGGAEVELHTARDEAE
ncbi:MAG: dihydroneopterin aldolase [Spirochaetia bacterium]